MQPYQQRLTEEEVARNTPGPMIIYEYTPTCLGSYSAPDYFPPVPSVHAKSTNVYIEDIRIAQDNLIKGVYPGVDMGIYYPGFPTMKHLRYTVSILISCIVIFCYF